MGFSLTYKGVAVMVIGYVLRAAGIEFVSEDWDNVINAVIMFGGALVTLYGRYRAGGLKNIFGAKAQGLERVI